MKVSAQYAQEHFPDILTAASSGEEVEISRPGQPSVRLMVMEPALAQKKPAAIGKRILGAGRGEMRIPSEEEWAAMDKEIAHQMNEGSLFPPEHP